MAFFKRGKKATRTKKRGRSQIKGSGRAAVWSWVLVGVFVCIVVGVGLLKWSRSLTGQAALLSLGSEKMYAEVQNAVGQALTHQLPGFNAGAMDPTEAGHEADYDWPADHLVPGAAAYCRVVSVSGDRPWWQLQQEIAAAVEAVGGQVLWSERLLPARLPASRTKPDDQKDLLRLDVGVPGHPTHTLVLHRQGRIPSVVWGQGTGQSAWAQLTAQQNQPTIALVIDDWGNNRNGPAQQLNAIRVPLTLSVLPGLPYSRHFALQGTDLVLPQTRAGRRGRPDSDQALGRRLRQDVGCFVDVSLRAGKARLQARRREIMLHLPMEPQSYPETDPGANALMTGMDGPAVAALLDKALTALPMVTGVNNHMGSAATADPATMATLMGELKKRDLFFLDSLTTSRSVGCAEARKAQVPTLKNRLFLDYDNTNSERIEANLKRLVQAARATGFAVGLCHPHPATAQVLARELPRLQDAGIRFVTVSEMMALQALHTADNP